MAIKNVEITNRVLKREGSSGSVSNVPSSLSYDLRELANKVDNSFFGKLFSAIDSDGNVIPVNGSATPVRIRANFDFFSVGESSAFGIDPSGGGGGGGGVTVYDGLDSTNPNIALSANQGRVLKGLIDNMDLSAYALKSELATVATSGSYNDLTNKPTIPAAQIQSDWNQTTTTAKDYIKNKPTKLSQFTNDSNYVTSSSLTTTLASYATQTWVTNKGYATTSAMNTELAKYLPLTGGTMSNTNLVTNLNADLLDGVHLTSLVRKYPQENYDLNELGVEGSMYRLGNANTNAFPNSDYGNVLVVGVRDYLTCYQLGAPYKTQKLYFRTGGVWDSDSDSIRTNPWKEIAFIDSNVASATALETSRTLWGQSFDGSANVSGDMTGVGNITASGYINVSNENGAIRLISSSGRGVYDVTSSKWLIGTNGTNTYLMGGNVGIGTTSPTYKLHVEGTGYFSGLITASGNIKTASYIEIGDYRIVADTANTALKVVHKNGTTAVNFYATGENSALGVNTSGGGGGDGASLEAVWTSLGSSTGTYGSSQINASHLTNALASYATQSWVNQQGFLKSYTETDPVFVASPAHGITASNISAWNNKQDAISDLATIRSNASAGAAKVSNVQADWTATSGLAVILHKPTLATVATSGKYSDLTGAPTKVSDFTNDANYVTSSSLATTLASYATTSAMNTALSGYLPLTGGTLSGNLSVERTGTTDSSKVTVTNGNGGVSLATSTPNRGIYDDDNSKWLIGTNGNNTFLLDGYVGINTTAPSYLLHVNGYTYSSRYYSGGSNYLAGDSTQLYFMVGSVTPLTAGSTYVRRGTSDSDVTLGTSSYRWANLYSVLGNFSGQITSSVATGTSPLSVASTTLNENLNADLLDGYHATDIHRLGWVSVKNEAGSSDQCKWFEVNVPTSYGGLYVYEIISRRAVYPLVAYYRLAIYRYNTNVVNVSLINEGFNYRSANNTRVCVAIDSNQRVYIQSGSRTASNYLDIRPILNQGGVNTTAVGEAAFGTANGFTALKMITDSGYFRVNTSTATQSTDYDGDPMMITSLRIGDAYIWWDGSSLRITGANASGNPVASVAVNVNVSGEISALKTS